VSAASKGGDRRPSPLRALFARLRRSRDPVPAPAPVLATTPHDPPPKDAPAVLLLAPPPTVSPPRQISLLEAPAQPHGNRMLVIHDVVERFRQMVRRQGIGRGDPLAPVLDLQVEMLVHFGGVSEDLRADLAQFTDRWEARFLHALEQARRGIGDEAGRVERGMARATERMETIAAETRQQRADVLAGFTAETEKLLSATVIRQAGVRIWCDRIIALVFFAAAITGAVWIGHTWGQEEGQQQMKTAIDETEHRVAATMLRDGRQVGVHWMQLMEWNDLDSAPRSCASQTAGAGSRQACSYTFWEDPPPNDPPQP
jgi:hypothetical protein